jgi:hypothetical protein
LTSNLELCSFRVFVLIKTNEKVVCWGIRIPSAHNPSLMVATLLIFFSFSDFFLMSEFSYRMTQNVIQLGVVADF